MEVGRACSHEEGTLLGKITSCGASKGLWNRKVSPQVRARAFLLLSLNMYLSSPYFVPGTVLGTSYIILSEMNVIPFLMAPRFWIFQWTWEQGGDVYKAFLCSLMCGGQLPLEDLSLPSFCRGWGRVEGWVYNLYSELIFQFGTVTSSDLGAVSGVRGECSGKCLRVGWNVGIWILPGPFKISVMAVLFSEVAGSVPLTS